MDILKKSIFTDYSLGMFRDDDLILGIITDKKDARRGRILRCDLIRREGEGLTGISLIAQKEEDEYDLLLALPDYLKEAKRVVTYNGTSFDVPFLRRRYTLFGLPEPGAEYESLDLYRELKSISAFFSLPSRRLIDIREFLRLHEGDTAEETSGNSLRILEAMGMMHFKEFLYGAYTFQAVRTDGELLICQLSHEGGFPCSVSVHDGPFHVRFSRDGSAVISARSYGGMLRFYHTDISNYEYLPLEGFAVHKSASGYVDRSRKEKATRENCFHLVRLTDSFVTEPERAAAYLSSVLSYLRSVGVGGR